MPVIGPLAKSLNRLFQSTAYETSQKYWLERYRNNGNSGSGSYGRLAQFKAEFLNDFVSKHSISTVIELGCGDGAQLALTPYPAYVGVDISAEAVARCKEGFRTNPAYRFFCASERSKFFARYQLALSLDVIFHLTEDDIFWSYMDDLFTQASQYVIIYSSNFDGVTTARHVRHRKFTDDIDKKYPEWTLLQYLKNPYSYDSQDPDNTSFADFYVFARSQEGRS